jgi:hypothetical protein
MMDLEGLLIDFYAIAARVSSLAQVSHDPIDLNLPSLNHLLGLPPGGNPILREDFL